MFYTDEFSAYRPDSTLHYTKPLPSTQTNTNASTTNASTRPTKEAFIYAETWDEETRTDPPMKWMEDYTNIFDTGDAELIANEYTVYPYTFIKSDGTEANCENAGEAAKTIKEVYQAFTKYAHIPYYISNIETDYGWECIGQAQVYGNLPGQAGPGEPAKVKDAQGIEWDVKVPGAFRFQ